MFRTRNILLGVVAVVLLAVGFVAYEYVFRRSIPSYASDEEHFLYGSIGNDGESGVPYPIWAVLPTVFADLMPGPGGYQSLGIRFAPGRSDLPVGFSRARVGVERMAINCAFCHATSVHVGAERLMVAGGPSNTTDVLAYQRFLSASARDPRFSPDTLLPAMAAAGQRLSWLDRQVYRYAIIPVTRQRLLEQANAFAWTNARPTWGPGRIDPFNPVKFGMLALPDDGTIGNSDMQPVWGLDARERIRPQAPMHWDGLNNSIREVIISSALGDGATAREFDWNSMTRIERYLRQLSPPPSPHRPDAAAAARGAQVFERACAQCHGPGGERTLTLIPVQEVGTDAHRVQMWTDAARDAYNGYRQGYDWGFRSFRNIVGYITEPLTGLWLMAPYLHNGSVPTLADLLEPPERRPRAFQRGLEELDPVRGGFRAPACEPSARTGPFCFDTSVPGNSNAGHAYGTDLPAAEKADLLAYLLTL